MTNTPDDEPQSRPLAVFKTPKPSSSNDTTAIADVVFGPPENRDEAPGSQAAARHAGSPAENPDSPQDSPQGYPQGGPGYAQESSQENPQRPASYPQDDESYPQASASSPQVSGSGSTRDAQGRSPNSSSAASGSRGGESKSQRRRRIHDIEFPQPEPENPFAEAEARVLEQIRARQRAQAMAAETQYGGADPQTSRLRPRMADEAPPPSRSRSSSRKRAPSNPFAETEAANRELDRARHVAAEQARAERARVEAAGQVSASPHSSAAPVSGPGGHPGYPTPVSGQPTSGIPVSGPTGHSVSGPAGSGSAGPGTAGHGSVAPVSGPAGRSAPVSGQPGSAPPASDAPGRSGVAGQASTSNVGPSQPDTTARRSRQEPARRPERTAYPQSAGAPQPPAVGVDTPGAPGNRPGIGEEAGGRRGIDDHQAPPSGSRHPDDTTGGINPVTGSHAAVPPIPTSLPPGPHQAINPPSGSHPAVPRPSVDSPTGSHTVPPPPVNPATGARPVTPRQPGSANPPTGEHRTVNPHTGPHNVIPPPVNPPTGQHRVVGPPVDARSGQHPTVDPRLSSRVAPQSPAPLNPPSGQHQAVEPRQPKRGSRSRRGPEPTDPKHQQLVPMSRSAVDGTTEKRPARLPKPPRRKDRSAAQELAITEIAGHTTFTPTAVTAWYRLPEVRWAFRPDAEREALISAIAEQYAGMAGYRLHLRRTTRPFPADQWARTVDDNTPRPLPPVQGAPNWADHLVNAQHHLHNVQHAEGETYLGISFARRTLADTLGEKFGRVLNRGTKRSERTRVERATEQFDEVLSAFGVRARRANSHELEWLIFRSVALGMDPPQLLSGVRDGMWEPGDVLALTEQIERYRTPYGSTVKLVNRLTGEERHVAVLTVGRMEDLEIPERHEPWLHFHERAPWPMELSSRLDILGPGEAFRNLEHRLRMIRSQQHDYDEHAMDAPPELERLAQRALHVGDEMTTGLATDAARVHGWHRIAVAADDRDECLERARKLIQMYNRELRLSLQHPKNQDWLAREFIPGEPVANTGYLRRMPVRLFAAALPQAASTVGDQRGDLIGRTSGTCRRPVFLDLHFPMEVRERSGLAVFVAEPGGGKSTLMGSLGYLAARRGVQVTLLDPSGPLARLCEMPELKPYSRVLNLTGSQPGTLAPYALIPTPKREHWDPGPEGDREYKIAVSNARAERRMLVQDICSMLVPPQVAREASTARLLRHAARQVPGEETSTLEDVVDCLQDQGEDGSELAALLLDAAEMPLAMLFFGSPPAEMLTDDAMLTVITMAGLRLPDLKIEREYWSAEEALALPMLHTAHRLAVRRSYGGDIHRRKLVGLDEAHFMEGWRSGRSFLVRMARDSRKWNLAALVASQNPTDILGLDVQNLVSTVFVGRIAEDPQIAAEALRMLRVPRDVGYEQTLAGLSEADITGTDRLSYREFIMRDVDGRVQRMRADISYVPRLLEYLDTTPGGRAAAERPANTPGNASQRTGPAGSQMGSG